MSQPAGAPQSADGYRPIRIAGGDTATPLCLGHRARFFAENLPRPCKVLDCGCGSGDYVLQLTSAGGFDAFGVEYEAAKVAKAKANPLIADRVEQGDLETLRKPDNSFDGALLNEVLEHIPNESKALREIHRVLKPGAMLIVCSPNRFFPFETHGSHWKGSEKSVPHWVPFIPWIPLGLAQTFLSFWARNYWPGQLQTLLRQAGFEIVKTTYFWPTFENISGRQPTLIRLCKPFLRWVSNLCSSLPGLRCFGVSQVYVCRTVK